MKDRQPYAIGKVILPIEIGVPATLLFGCMRYKTDPVISIVRVSADTGCFPNAEVAVFGFTSRAAEPG